MAQSIRDLGSQIKARTTGFLGTSLASDLGILAIILLVGIGSFGLGRLSMTPQGGGAGQIAITQVAAAAAADTPAPIPPGGQLVASRSGSKYYYPWCGGVKNIKPSNLIWFDGEEKARAAGYSPAANCKGL